METGTKRRSDLTDEEWDVLFQKWLTQGGEHGEFPSIDWPSNGVLLAAMAAGLMGLCGFVTIGALGFYGLYRGVAALWRML